MLSLSGSLVEETTELMIRWRIQVDANPVTSSLTEPSSAGEEFMR